VNWKRAVLVQCHPLRTPIVQPLYREFLSTVNTNKHRVVFQVLVAVGLTVLACVTRAQTPTTPPDANKVLTASEQMLVDSSKKAIISTGITEDYFNSHFKVLHVFNEPADRRVSWLFTINEYQTVVNDSIGFYTEGKQQSYVHSVSTTLGRTVNIYKTLTLAKASQIMKSCIGPFTDPVVLYGPYDGRAALYLSASRYIDPRSEAEKQLNASRKAQRKAADSQRAISKDSDVISTGDQIDERQPKVIFGNVNLQTGKCTIGGWARRGVFKP
jgi:hypothetical protein